MREDSGSSLRELSNQQIADLLEEISDELCARKAFGVLLGDFPFNPTIPALAASCLRMRALDLDRRAARQVARLNRSTREERLAHAQSYLQRKPEATVSEIARFIATKQQCKPATIEKFLWRHEAEWREKKSGQV